MGVGLLPAWLYRLLQIIYHTDVIENSTQLPVPSRAERIQEDDRVVKHPKILFFG